MSRIRYETGIRVAVVAVAGLFGLLTLFAGTRILLGGDPGYTVYRPLLTYNTVMGLAYLGGAVFAWKNVETGRAIAATIFILNLLVMGIVYYLYTTQNVVAFESLRAMSLRTGVWFVLFLGLAWLNRRSVKGQAYP